MGWAVVATMDALCPWSPKLARLPRGSLPEGLSGVARLGQVLWPQEEQGEEPAMTRLSCGIQEEPTLLTKWQRAAGGAQRAPRARCRGEESGEGRLSPAEGAP